MATIESCTKNVWCPICDPNGSGPETFPNLGRGPLGARRGNGKGKWYSGAKKKA